MYVVPQVYYDIKKTVQLAEIMPFNEYARGSSC